MRFFDRTLNWNITRFFYLKGVKVLATAAEIDAAAVGSVSPAVSAGNQIVVSSALHSNKYINLDSLTGSLARLPPATGSGAKFRFRTTIVPTSNDHRIIVDSSTDTIQGIAFSRDDTAAAVLGYATTATSDAVVMNGTTTGAADIGNWVELEDVADTVWQVQVHITNTGASATPFQAIV